MKDLKNILKNKQFEKLEVEYIDNLEFPFIAQNVFTKEFYIIDKVSQINCELQGFKVINS
jgi:hypothetical protein